MGTEEIQTLMEFVSERWRLDYPTLQDSDSSEDSWKVQVVLDLLMHQQTVVVAIGERVGEYYRTGTLNLDLAPMLLHMLITSLRLAGVLELTPAQIGRELRRWGEERQVEALQLSLV